MTMMGFNKIIKRLKALWEQKKSMVASLNEKGIEASTNEPMDALTEKSFEAGKKAEYDAFWDIFQDNGAKTEYSYAFAYGHWNKDNFKPKHDIKPSGSAEGMFRASQRYPNDAGRYRLINMKEIEQELGIVFDFSNVTGAIRMFDTSFFAELNCIDLSNCKQIQYCFRTETGLNAKRIERLIFGVPCSHSGGQPFHSCTNLEYVGFEGTIDCNTLDLSYCTKLAKECLVAFLNCLVDKTGVTGTWSATLGSANLAKLTDEEIAIAEAKGWVLK